MDRQLPEIDGYSVTVPSVLLGTLLHASNEMLGMFYELEAEGMRNPKLTEGEWNALLHRIRYAVIVGQRLTRLAASRHRVQAERTEAAR